MPEYTQDTIEQLVDGRLPWPELRRTMSSFKDDGRFAAYVAALQQRVPWEDRIVLPLSDNLFIVQRPDGELVTNSRPGFDFGDYRRNWKLKAVIFERDTLDLMNESTP
jgi:acetone carboxylase gamma subunit